MIKVPPKSQLYMVAKNPGHWPLLVKKMPNISQGSVATRLTCGGMFNPI